MAYNTKPIVTDKDGNPISQYYNPDTDSYEPVEGANGANKVLVMNNDLSLIPILEKLSQLTGTVIDEETRKSNELQRIALYNQIKQMLENGELKGEKGDTGIGLNYRWQGTYLGIKREDETEFVYVDLKGEKGDKGDKGDPGDIENLTKQHILNALQYTPVKSVNNVLADETGNVELDIDTSAIENRIGKVEDDLESHKADYAYQIPTIVGTQIRIKQQSNTNRLYFKLDNDLEGNITISLDNGSTQLPLKDIYGEQITFLERGYIEVVKETDFFTLRPKWGVNDTLPPQIENFNATASDGKVVLTWTISDTTYLDGYAFTYKANEIPSSPNDGTKVFADKLSTSLVIDGLTNDVLYYIRAFPYNNKKQYQTEYRVVQSIPKAGIPISDLPIGAKVKFGKYQVESEPHQPIIWLIAAKNHIGYPANSITLITEKIIDLRGFDAKEPSNSDSDRQKYGNNRYRDSNIRQWLNKAGLNWYVKTHTADEPPTDDGMSQPTGYDNKEGFLSSFTEDELNIILDTTLTVARNTVTDGGGSETVVDKIFLASFTEVGFENENGIAEGSLLPLFSSDDASRIAYVTQQCFNNTKSGSKPFSISNGWYWWLRTPLASSVRNVRYVKPDGSRYSDFATYGHYGVRPLCNLKSDILVSSTVDSDGCYTVLV